MFAVDHSQINSVQDNRAIIKPLQAMLIKHK